MPEGHTLHRIALALNEAFAGRTIAASSPQGRFAQSAAEIDGTEMINASAHGKHLFCEFDDDRWLHVHLGLIGSFLLSAPEPPRGQVRLRLATQRTVADLRGPQLCAIQTSAEIEAQVAALGPDPLRSDADPDIAWRRIRRASRPIAALLMDQEILSGVGNVYRAEVLFRNRVNPHRPGSKLSRRSWQGIWCDLVELMPIGVRDGRIDTVRPEDRPEAMRWPPREDRASEVYVYRRAGHPCLVCGSRIRTEVLAGRNLFWCAYCQRRG